MEDTDFISSTVGGIANAVQVDRHLSEKMEKQAADYRELSLFLRNFGDPGLPAEVGDVDAIILFSNGRAKVKVAEAPVQRKVRY